MVETRISTTRGRDQAAASVNENPRNSRRKRRMQVLKDARGDRGTVRVVPRDDAMRAVLKHQPSGIAFRKEGGMEWPNDRFTQKRLRDGSVKLEPKKSSTEDQPQAQVQPPQEKSKRS
jgi:hypothetical protein